MATTVEEIEADIQSASAPGFRGRLLARGQARAMIWRDGVLPPDAPEFSDLLSYDRHSYGCAMLGLGLRLRELEGSHDLVWLAFWIASAPAWRSRHVSIARPKFHIKRGLAP